MAPRLIFCNGSSSPWSRLAHAAGWDVGYRSDYPFRGGNAGLPVAMVDWPFRSPDWERHVRVVAAARPDLAVAPDIDDVRDLGQLERQVATLAELAGTVVVVPKASGVAAVAGRWPRVILGLSVPTRYGSVGPVPEWEFRAAPVHLLGGPPLVQWRIAQALHVVSLDCKTHMRGAAYGTEYVAGLRTATTRRPPGTAPPDHVYALFTRSCEAIRAHWHA